MISHNDIFWVRSDWSLLFGWTELHSTTRGIAWPCWLNMQLLIFHLIWQSASTLMSLLPAEYFQLPCPTNQDCSNLPFNHTQWPSTHSTILPPNPSLSKFQQSPIDLCLHATIFLIQPLTSVKKLTLMDWHAANFPRTKICMTNGSMA